MSTTLLAIIIIALTAAVVAAFVAIMWRERRSPQDGRVVIVSGVVLSVWAVVVATLASRGSFVQADAHTAPPIGIVLLVVLLGLVVVVSGSPTLRRLLSNQANLTRLNVWRLVGAVFLVLMVTGQMPALWALPAGIGDVLIGLAAFPVAAGLDRPGGRTRAIVFNLLGLLDLIVAIGLGMTTSAGPVQLFHTVPTSQLATHFPLALVPTFLVPLATMVHLVSLWQLFRGSWAPNLSVGVVPR